MKTKALIFSGAALLALAVSPVFAQQPNSASPDPSIAQRKDNQQDRIANGVQSGELTAGETKSLETSEANLNKEESHMRAADNGHLTAADRAKLNNQQNHLSNRIYDDKHNANTAHYGNNEVGQRRENQQDRIAQGIRSGQLTAGETAKLERQQQSINHEDASMRAANGGKLTAADKAALNQRQNNASKNIYAKKHNSQTR
ncbi:MAG TPA: hypothetical protein VEJ45_11235 [Candidatus Acidoferrales bacterium]|nr:hypothetical protein [Candidatus Acidoferrales bacterium]